MSITCGTGNFPTSSLCGLGDVEVDLHEAMARADEVRRPGQDLRQVIPDGRNFR